MRDMVAGRTMAPPMPWMTRATMSSSPDPASPAKIEAAVNALTPMTSMRRRPMRSASVPNGMRRAAKTSV